MSFDYDFAIVGSGFGGSVAAFRLAEKGYRVCVIEKGKRFSDEQFPKTNWDLPRYLWLPFLKFFGIQGMRLFRHVLILHGVGVGGGSLVYANTLVQPGDEFFEAPVWRDLGDWKKELLPHYKTAKRMLGATTNQRMTFVDEVLRECAQDLGNGVSFRPSEVGVFFGEPGKKSLDPYFDGKGPERQGCILCGGCMVGCRHNAKNTLVKNYLYFAEKLGVQIFPETQVINITPLDKGYELATVQSTRLLRSRAQPIRAQKVVLSAGVLGTVDLLLKCKYVTRTLPEISNRLGHDVRTNSEALVGVTDLQAVEKNRNYSEGIAITSIISADPHTHVEPVRYPKGSTFMRLLATPMIDGPGGFLRIFKWLVAMISQPMQWIRLHRLKEYAESTVILLVMQTLDNKMRFQIGRNIFTLFKKKMVSSPERESHRVPAYIPVAHQVARNFSKKVGGVPQSAVNEVLLNIPTTAHILGGCGMGSSAATGVIDKDHRVFGYPGIYVCDGSAIPANLGVNPSLTITAMTERAMARISPRGSSGVEV